ncbi:MAG: hypothetical protein M4579_004321 [Chaenotheca gracillima]|nr:MAG: hypothetical protein M4579_004321 [Chaenotheca gracillima]
MSKKPPSKKAGISTSPKKTKPHTNRDDSLFIPEEAASPVATPKGRTVHFANNEGDDATRQNGVKVKKELTKDADPEYVDTQEPEEEEEPEVEDSEDEHETAARRAEEEQDDSEEFDGDGNPIFRSHLKLDRANVVSMKLSAITSLMNSPYLDLDPPYQREVVWTDDRMSGLVDSLFENYYIPPVIFNTYEVEKVGGAPGEKTLKRVCVDGKQRLSSIQKFMNGEIHCHDRHGKKWLYNDKISKTGRNVTAGYKPLPDHIKAEFRSKELVCYEFKELAREQEEDLFARVQKGMVLSEAEKLKATAGPWQAYASMFEDHFKEVLALCMNNKRAAGWRHLLECFSLMMEAQHPSGDRGFAKLKTSAKELKTLVKSPRLLTEQFKTQSRNAFNVYLQLVRDYPEVFTNTGYTKVKTYSPLEMVSIAVLIHLNPGRPVGMLQGDVTWFRTAMREAHDDLRLNTTCWKTVWSLISRLEDYRGTTDATEQIPIRQSRTPSQAPTHAINSGPSSLPNIPIPEDSERNDPSYAGSRSARNKIQPARSTRGRRSLLDRNNSHRDPALSNGTSPAQTGQSTRQTMEPREAIMQAADDAIRTTVAANSTPTTETPRAPVAQMTNGSGRRKRQPLDLGQSSAFARNLEKRLKRSPSSERAEEAAAASAAARNREYYE